MGLEALIALLALALIYGSPVLLFFGAWRIGEVIESSHYAAIRRREEALAHIPAAPIRTPEAGREVAAAWLVTGCVVVSNDYFKKTLAGLRKIFGGRLRAYESLMDRARREAVLRLKESCPEAHAVLNMRIETSTISQTARDQGMGAIEVMACGTAIRYR